MTKASRIDTSQKYPCWVYLSEHPIQLQRCATRSAWHHVRRHGWARVDPKRVGRRLRALFEDMQFNEADAYLYLLQRSTQLEDVTIKQGLFYRVVRGEAPDIAFTPDLLEKLSDTFCVPMDWFYLPKISGVPLLFGDKNNRRVQAQLVVQPYEAPGTEEYEEAAARNHPVVQPPGTRSGYDYTPDVPHRVYHLLYELHGAEQHRAHIIASSKKKAVHALKIKHSDAIILKCSSQKLKEGMIIENY